MTTLLTAPVDPSVRHAIDVACARIAPAWPLDRLIAVNPWWGFVDRPIRDAAADLGALGGARLTMPRGWFAAQAAKGRLTEAHVRGALALLAEAAPGASRLDLAEVLAALRAGEEPAWPVVALMPDVVDATRDVVRHTSWREFVVEHVSHACGAWFGEGQASWPAAREAGLYGLWRDMAHQDAGVRLLMGLRGFRAAVDALPEDPEATIALAFDELGVPASLQPAYATALLLSVSGWAAACAFQRWEARLAGRDDDQLVHLLAVRAAWELVLYRTSGAPGLTAAWAGARRRWAGLADAVRDAQAIDWVLQRALELAYQEPVVRQLAGARTRPATPPVQAVFCIDVRSEVMRRALEAASPEVGTLGFAGFFGVPIAYAAADGVTRPQLPGLLAPSLLVADTGPDAVAQRDARTAEATLADTWKRFTTTAASAFTAVEATGLTAAVSLARRTLGGGTGDTDPLRGALATPASALSPRLVGRAADGSALDLAARTALAAGVLRGMSLTQGMGRLVALIGHGATTCNNPQAAGLACGACGGQSGEVNARALAALLNEGDVREALVAEGITVPAGTHFVPGLHDTVTDGITVFDVDAVPATHAADLQALVRACEEASQAARRERAPRLGLGALVEQPRALAAAMARRATDWSEVRPEWALARNAAFIIAPRERTRGVHLDGRAFLHEYRWQEDTTHAVLELILTAPMVVTNWINLQYHASTVDPERFGSGDKVLHNVAGGNVGVFEGAGGDLRIGLARQSVHDGIDWMHEPLRLSVFVEAPAPMIDGIIAKHAVVRHLVEHEWLHLFRIEPSDGQVYRRARTGWWPVTAA